MKRINPPREKDALVDYREHRRTTPKGALAEINRLKHSDEFDRNQLRLLKDLEDYIQTQFKMDTDQHGQALINFGDK
jgi:hypothetical protein